MRGLSNGQFLLRAQMDPLTALTTILVLIETPKDCHSSVTTVPKLTLGPHETTSNLYRAECVPRHYSFEFQIMTPANEHERRIAQAVDTVLLNYPDTPYERVLTAAALALEFS